MTQYRKDENLAKAVKENNLISVQKLIALGADVHVYEDLPLRQAVKNNNLAMTKFLLEQGADINVKEGNPLKIAETYQFDEIAAYLLAYGANESPKTQEVNDLNILTRWIEKNLYTIHVDNVGEEYICSLRTPYMTAGKYMASSSGETELEAIKGVCKWLIDSRRKLCHIPSILNDIIKEKEMNSGILLQTTVQDEDPRSRMVIR